MALLFLAARAEAQVSRCAEWRRRSSKIVRVNRRWLFVVAGLLLLPVASGTWLILTWEPDHPLSKRNYRRIMPGMTRDEVADILGGPPGPVGPVPEGPWFVELVEQEGPVTATGMLQGKPAIWYSERGQILVTFNSWEKSARVVGKQLYRRARGG
jgi:hypothetical protein